MRCKAAARITDLEMNTRTDDRPNIHDADLPGMTYAGAMVTLLHNSAIITGSRDFIDLVLEGRECRRVLAGLGY